MKDGKACYKNEGCIECGACVGVCPVEALSL
ncbi:MAG: 4Fe-4S binding protein [Candidatus Riflebacteria bacterium]